MDLVLELLVEIIVDIGKMIPFLFVAYYCMERLEHTDTFFLKNYLVKAKGFAPLIGSLLGVIPQCGFGVIASALYVNHSITIGTLFAVFVSTSDEAIPILLANPEQFSSLLQIVLLKIIVACICGYGIDFFMRFKRIKISSSRSIVHSNCLATKESIIKLTIKRTFKMTFFLVLITISLQLVMEYFISTQAYVLFQNIPLVQIIVAAIIGFIPNCASSILLSQAYLSNLISFGALFAGLVSSSGIGYLVLWRLNRNVKEVILISLGLLLVACISGLLLL